MAKMGYLPPMSAAYLSLRERAAKRKQGRSAPKAAIDILVVNNINTLTSTKHYSCNDCFCGADIEREGNGECPHCRDSKPSTSGTAGQAELIRRGGFGHRACGAHGSFSVCLPEPLAACDSCVGLVRLSRLEALHCTCERARHTQDKQTHATLCLGILLGVVMSTAARTHTHLHMHVCPH
jgi:hypothetical protein